MTDGKTRLIRQTKNNEYDTYDSAVVACKGDYNAAFIHPDGSRKFYGDFDDWVWTKGFARVLRYRTRKPKGLKMLEELIQNLPAPTKEMLVSEADMQFDVIK